MPLLLSDRVSWRICSQQWLRWCEQISTVHSKREKLDTHVATYGDKILSTTCLRSHLTRQLGQVIRENKKRAMEASWLSRVLLHRSLYSCAYPCILQLSSSNTQCTGYEGGSQQVGRD